MLLRRRDEPPCGVLRIALVAIVPPLKEASTAAQQCDLGGGAFDTQARLFAASVLLRASLTWSTNKRCVGASVSGWAASYVATRQVRSARRTRVSSHPRTTVTPVG